MAAEGRRPGEGVAGALPGARRRSSWAAPERTRRSHARFGAGRNGAGGAWSLPPGEAVFLGRRWHVRSGPGSAAWRDLGVRGPVPLHGSRPQRTLGA